MLCPAPHVPTVQNDDKGTVANFFANPDTFLLDTRFGKAKRTVLHCIPKADLGVDAVTELCFRVLSREPRLFFSHDALEQTPFEWSLKFDNPPISALLLHFTQRAAEYLKVEPLTLPNLDDIKPEFNTLEVHTKLVQNGKMIENFMRNYRGALYDERPVARPLTFLPNLLSRHLFRTIEKVSDENETSEALKLFLASGVGDCQRNNSDETYLGVLARRTPGNALEVLQAMLNEKFDPNALSNGRSPLSILARREGLLVLKMMEALLAAGGDPSLPDRKGRTPIHVVAANNCPGALAMMNALLRAKGNPNACAPDGLTPLHVVAANQGRGALEMMKALLAARGDPSLPDCKGRTPVHVVAANQGPGALAMMEALLRAKGNPHACAQDGQTPLHVVAANQGPGALEMMKALLAAGRNSSLPDCKGQTPLHVVAANQGPGALEMMKALLAAGGDPHACAQDGQTPFHVALANKGDFAFEMMMALKEEKGYPEYYQLGTPRLLHVVAANQGRGALEMMNALLREGIKPSLPDCKGQTPLDVVAANQGPHAPGMVKALLHEYEVLRRNPFLDSGSVCAAAANEGEHASQVMKLLLEGGAATSILGDGNPLFIVARNKGPDGLKIARLLLGKGFAVKCDILKLAAQNEGPCAFEMLKLFVQSLDKEAIDDKTLNDVIVSVVKNEGPCAFKMLSFLSNQWGPDCIKDEWLITLAFQNEGPDGLKVLKALRKAGATNKDKYILMNLAAANKGPHALDMLEMLMPNVNLLTPFTPEPFAPLRLPLHMAASNSSKLGPDLVRALLKFGADPADVDNSYRTPLHKAAMNTGPEASKIVQILLAADGSKLLVEDSDANTPLYLVAENSGKCALEIAQMFVERLERDNHIDLIINEYQKLLSLPNGDDQNQQVISYLSEFILRFFADSKENQERFPKNLDNIVRTLRRKYERYFGGVKELTAKEAHERAVRFYRDSMVARKG